jgi:dihydroorotase
VSGAIVVRNARHWRTGRSVDLAFADGCVLSEVPSSPSRTLDAGGAVIAPGLVDAHVHLREPGQSGKETIATGARAAAAGGFTDVMCMPNTSPVLDSPAWIEWVAARGREAGHCRVHPIAALSVGQQGQQMAELVSLARSGAVAFSDDGRPVRSAGLMRRALEYARATGRPIIAHEEDLDLKGEGHMNEGPVATRLGVRGIPSAAESVMVRRDVELAALTRGCLHLAHLSCRESLDALRDARQRGLDVTGETCPHYWTLTDEAVAEHGAAAKMNPPLRSSVDRSAVIAAIADGTIECLVTDHAPHTVEDKRRTLDQAPFGIVGLETALGLTQTFLVRPGHVTLSRAIELWTDAPRRRFGLPAVTLEAGSSADFVLFDPEATWRVDPERFHSKGRNTPFGGWTLHGKVLLTVCEGRITHEAAGATEGSAVPTGAAEGSVAR